MATHFHTLTVKDIRRETPECISIAFDIPDALKNEFKFIHGQNITVKTTIEGEEIRRSYSICSSPLDNELRIAVKKVADGKFSSWANSELRKESRLEVLPPSGKFYTSLGANNKKNYVAFAAGSGITPLLSIIKTTLVTEPQSSFTLIYGNRSRSSIIFKEELEALKNKFINRLGIYHILSREKTDVPLSYGRINEEKCESIFRHLIDLKTCDEFFLCGPEEMIFLVKDYLEKKQVAREKIHFELFTTPGVKKSEDRRQNEQVKKEYEGKTSKVTIKLDGVAFDFDLPYNGDAVLDAALQLGADLPFACKGGVCATCRAKLIEGKVEMDINYALEAEEIKNGFVLTCQSHPRSEKLIIDFDVR